MVMQYIISCGMQCIIRCGDVMDNYSHSYKPVRVRLTNIEYGMS